MAGSAGAVRGFPGHPHAPYALEQTRRLERMFERLADDPDHEYAMIDSTGGIANRKRSGVAQVD